MPDICPVIDSMLRPINGVVNQIKRYRGLPKEIYVLFAARIVNSLGAFVFPLLTLILTEKLGRSLRFCCSRRCP